jgi:error-prone DNA polymerase
MGFPRQLGQHTGGFVITRRKLSDLCPILNARMVDRTCIEWNKDDIDALGFMKVDLLALGMLTCIRKAFDIAK